MQVDQLFRIQRAGLCILYPVVQSQGECAFKAPDSRVVVQRTMRQIEQIHDPQNSWTPGFSDGFEALVLLGARTWCARCSDIGFSSFTRILC
jgi:hypothetical protein